MNHKVNNKKPREGWLEQFQKGLETNDFELLDADVFEGELLDYWVWHEDSK